MSETVILLIINAVILPIVGIILKINREQNSRIDSLEKKLDDCLSRKGQGETWQHEQGRQRDMLIRTELNAGDTKPLE